MKTENLTAMLSVVAWFIFWLYHLGRSNPELAASKALSNELIKIVQISARKLSPKLANKAKSTIEDAVSMIARLGGLLARKGDGPLGTTSIWKGGSKLMIDLSFMT